jgi:uncharacterized protein
MPGGSNERRIASSEAMSSRSAVIPVRVKPRSPVAKLAGVRGGRLLIQVSAPPLDGKANEAVCRLLAGALGVARGRVQVLAGERNRDKLIRIDGLAPGEAARALSRSGVSLADAESLVAAEAAKSGSTSGAAGTAPVTGTRR